MTKGIEAKDSSNLKIINSKFIGLDTAVETKNVRGLTMHNNQIAGKLYKLTNVIWWKDPKFIIPCLLTIIIAVVGWIWFS